MFTLDVLKNKATSPSYTRGREYYIRGRVYEYSKELMDEDRYKIKGMVKGSQEYDVTMVINNRKNLVEQWYCTCPYNYEGICKHAVALGLKYHFDMVSKDRVKDAIADKNTDNFKGISLDTVSDKTDEIDIEQKIERTSRDSFNGNYKSTIINWLGQRDLSRLETYRTKTLGAEELSRIRIILMGFNLGSVGANRWTTITDNQPRRFAIKILIPDSGKGTKLTMDIIKRMPGSYSILFEYIMYNGVFINGTYYIAQAYIDQIIPMLEKVAGVVYKPQNHEGKDSVKEPVRSLMFSNEIYKPEIRLATMSDGSTSISFAEDLLMIPGKYTTFVLKDDTIMRLPEEIPPEFYMEFDKKTAAVDERLAQKFFSNTLPVMRKVLKIDEAQVKKVENIEIVPEVLLFIKKGEVQDEVYIEPEVKYEEYLSVNPLIEGRMENYRYSSEALEKRAAYKVEIGGRIISFQRDLFLEGGVSGLIRSQSFCFVDRDGRASILGQKAIFELITEFIPRVPGHWKILYDKGLEGLKVKKESVKVNFRFSMDSGEGLFDFDMDLYCGKMGITKEMLLDYIQNNKKFINDGNSFIEITNSKELKRLFDLLQDLDLKIKNEGKYQGRLYQASELDALVESSRQFSAQYGNGYESFIEQLKKGRPVEEVIIPDEFKSILRPYQADGVHWMYFLRKYGFGGILADDMGLGKTLQTIVLLSTLDSKLPSLIVCPKTLIFNWVCEIEKFAPGMKIIVIDGSLSERALKLQNIHESRVVITSYPLLQRDIEDYSDMEFEYCIIDEAQNIKNASTKTAKCVKSVKAKYRLALTGTPIENSLIELWSIFDFLMPGFLESENRFREKYEQGPSKTNEDSESGKSMLSLLRSKVKPFILRRTKKEMLKELPPKIEQTSYAEMTTGQLTLYMGILQQVKTGLYNTVAEKGFEKSQIEILAALTRLRQVCNHPGLVDEKFLEEDSVSGKLELFEELIEECMEGEHKVLVFSQFVSMLEILKRLLDRKGMHYCYLDGQSRNRQEIIEKFNNNDELRIFLISIKAGGFGLNLTSADTVIICDPWWNPMVEEQATDRAYRMGQQKPVNVYRLISKNTVEEKIQKLQERKRQLFDTVINENNDFIRKLTWEDLEEVLR